MVSCEYIAKHEINTIRVTEILFINITQLIKFRLICFATSMPIMCRKLSGEAWLARLLQKYGFYLEQPNFFEEKEIRGVSSCKNIFNLHFLPSPTLLELI